MTLFARHCNANLLQAMLNLLVIVRYDTVYHSAKRNDITKMCTLRPVLFISDN